MARTFHLSEEYFRRLRKPVVGFTFPLMVFTYVGVMYFDARRQSQSLPSKLPAIPEQRRLSRHVRAVFR